MSFCLVKQCGQCCSFLPFKLKLSVLVGLEQQQLQQSLHHAESAMRHEEPMRAA